MQHTVVASSGLGDDKAEGVGQNAGMAIWRAMEELVLVDGQATVWWLELTSPFGDAPAGTDWTLHLPEHLQIVDPSRRPCFGCGPDAHRPHVERHGQTWTFSFRGYLPGENQRRPMTHPQSWYELHYPLVVIGDTGADDQVVRLERRALGDQDERQYRIRMLEDPGERPLPAHRRCMQLLALPWFCQEEQELLAVVLRRCGVSDCSLNWHGQGLPLLPADAYAQTARTLRCALPDVRLWIGGLPGADTLLPRAQSRYGQELPFVVSPQAALAAGPDLVVASERSWCEAVDADGVMIALHEPAAVDTDALPAHCFRADSRAVFAAEQGLASVPDPLTILRQHREAWVDFCCRQVCRLIEIARRGHDGRPLAICAYGPGGPARDEASADWRQLADVADLLVYAHRQPAVVGRDCTHWGYTRVCGTPQAWWENWHDPLGSLDDPAMAAADGKMQLAFSGGDGLRIGSWAALDGRLQHALMEWR